MSAKGQASLGQFEADLTKWQRKLEARIDELVRQVGFACAENIIIGGAYAPGTPVDTGFARASWWISVGEPGGPHQPPDNPEKIRKDTNAAVEAASSLLGASRFTEVYIMSNTTYMPRLEFGSSGQAPQGMVRLTLRHAQEIVDAIAAQMKVG